MYGQIECPFCLKAVRKQIDIVQAIKIAHEYQLARMIAPLIPSWIWKRKRDDLNELWATYRTRSQTDNVR
jgi:hypothetical protein